MTSVTPQPKLPKLIVVAFDRYEEGELQPVFGPAEQISEDRQCEWRKSSPTSMSV
jgi:hypothetical protein